jgi:hypothetical protein
MTLGPVGTRAQAAMATPAAKTSVARRALTIIKAARLLMETRVSNDGASGATPANGPCRAVCSCDGGGEPLARSLDAESTVPQVRRAVRGRRDYGAIGTVTNLAARLCGEARGGQILVSRRLYTAVADLVEAEPLGELTLRGFARPVTAFNVLAARATA